MSIKRELQEIIKNSITDHEIELLPEDIIIETPKDLNNGDYSTTIAMSLAKKMHKNPIEIANTIKDIDEATKSNTLFHINDNPLRCE